MDETLRVDRPRRVFSEEDIYDTVTELHETVHSVMRREREIKRKGAQ